MLGDTVFRIQDLRKNDGEARVLEGITLAFVKGAKIGLVGPDSAGKSALMRILAGEDSRFEGVAEPAEGVSIGFLSSAPQLMEGKDVDGCLADAARPVRELLERRGELAKRIGLSGDQDAEGHLSGELKRLEDEIHRRQALDLDRRLYEIPSSLRLPLGHIEVETLSEGDRQRLSLCRLLVASPDMLLLEDPTRNLDPEALGWLEQHLRGYPGVVLLSTPDLSFLDGFLGWNGWILEIDGGRGRPFAGNRSHYVEVKKKLDSRPPAPPPDPGLRP